MSSSLDVKVAVSNEGQENSPYKSFACSGEGGGAGAFAISGSSGRGVVGGGSMGGGCGLGVEDGRALNPIGVVGMVGRVVECGMVRRMGVQECTG